MINMKGIAKKAFLGLTLGTSLLASSQLFSERINNKEHLQQIINEEKEKIGLKDMKVTGYIDYDGNALMRAGTPAYSCRGKGPSITYQDGRKVGGEDYGIVVIRSDIGMRRGCVKHELMHITNKDKGWKSVSYWIYGEPLANLYGAFSLDLKKR